MAKNLKYFLMTLLVGFPLWWGVNALESYLENFLYWFEIGNNPRLLAAQANQTAFQNQVIEMAPIRVKKVLDLNISAKSAISLLVDGRGKERILFEKEKDIRLPMASLTKIITAKVVLDNYDLSRKIKISEEAVNQEENFGKLTAGKELSVNYLLYPLLMESSNDAAFALADDYDGMTVKKFVELMNEESSKLGLSNTYFFNPTGLDPEEPDKDINYSTAFDLAKLTKGLLEESLLWEVLTTEKFNTYGPELVNTNELLGKLSGVVGGKTGYTEMASGCFLLVVKAPKGKGYIINVILGTGDRFGEMEKLITWLDSAYSW